MYHFLVVMRCPTQPVMSELVTDALRRAAPDYAIELLFTHSTKPTPNELAGVDAVLAVGEALDLPDGSPPTLFLAPETILTDPSRALVSAMVRLGVKDRGLSIVAVTACTVGVTHHFLAAQGLTLAAKAKGHRIKVETHSSVGMHSELTAEDIAAADLVLIAADTQAMIKRFAGKRVYRTSMSQAISHGAEVLDSAIASAATLNINGELTPEPDRICCTGPYEHLKTGVSFMLPFVAAGGLIIALAYGLEGIHAGEMRRLGSLGWSLFQVGGKAAFVLIVPVLAGYIAYSVADRPGIAPGMVGGMIATNMGAGFLGGIAAGFIAGYGTAWRSCRLRLPRPLQGLIPIVLLPFLGTLLTGLMMVYVIGSPIACLMETLTRWLTSMQSAGTLLLGMLNRTGQQADRAP